MRVRGDEVVRVLPFLLWLSEEFPLRGTGPRRAASHAQAYLCIFQFLELKPLLVSVYVVDIYLQMCCFMSYIRKAVCPIRRFASEILQVLKSD